jgi:NDP-sugar pyrophosphorylase family protein
MELQQRFASSYSAVVKLSPMLADYYFSKYWNDVNEDWDWNKIIESVVREIEKDVQNLSYL